MLRFLTVVVLAAVSTVGCATAQPTAPTGTADSLFPVATESAPSDTEQPSGDRGSLVARLEEDSTAFLRSSEQGLIADCMAEQGLQYEISATPPDDPLQTAARRHFRYGTDDIAWAREHGYGLSRPLASETNELAGEGPNQQHVESLSKADRKVWDEALNGTEDGELDVQLESGRTVFMRTEGCVAEARKILYGDLGKYLFFTYTVRELTENAQARVYDAPEYKAALDEWSDCMQAAGYSSSDTFELRENVRGRTEALGEDEAWLIEQATAVDDATCNREVGLYETASRLEGELTQEALEGSQDTVLQYLEMRAAALEAAEEAVDGHRG